MQSQVLPDGRLHLHHGPIDQIIKVWGPGTEAAYAAANKRFSTLLDELVSELPLLRAVAAEAHPQGVVARRMARAVLPHSQSFVTLMAAVAGAVADEICTTISQTPNIQKAYVNNGGDIAVFLTEGQSLNAAIYESGDAGRVTFHAANSARGLATSGWSGRSHSLGIADAVTVVAKNAASADVAATLIANAVDLPGHDLIDRQHACELMPDSDLGARLVTTGVATLARGDVCQALIAGKRVGDAMLINGLIDGAILFLQGQVVQVGNVPGLAP